MRLVLGAFSSALAVASVLPAATDNRGLLFVLEAAQGRYHAGEPIRLTWTLINQTGRDWLVLATSGGNDGITIHLDRVGSGPSRTFPLSVPSAASRPDFGIVPSGQTLARSFELTDFAQAFGVAIGPGGYVIRATYSVGASAYRPPDPAAPLWTGELASPPLHFIVDP